MNDDTLVIPCTDTESSALKFKRWIPYQVRDDVNAHSFKGGRYN